MISSLRLPLLLGLAVVFAGCSGAYYGAMEKLGFHKRDILVDRVQEARDAQKEAKEQFADALEKFLAVTGSSASSSDLKAKYDALSGEFRRSEDRAKEVRERLASVEEVSEALFAEWRKELGQYTNAQYRAQSERQLEATRRRYDDLIRVMRRAAGQMEPVLSAFRDQVLFLKHNLNAQALASLDTTAKGLQGDVQRLIADMEKSIREAEAFIQTIKTDA